MTLTSMQGYAFHLSGAKPEHFEMMDVQQLPDLTSLVVLEGEDMARVPLLLFDLPDFNVLWESPASEYEQARYLAAAKALVEAQEALLAQHTPNL